MEHNKSRSEFRDCYDEDEIDLYELFLILKEKWKIWIGSTLIFFFIALIYIFLKTPVYKAEIVIIPPPPITMENKKNEYMNFKVLGNIFINKLKILLKDSNFSLLSQYLDLSENEIKAIENISIVEIRKRENYVLKISIETTNKNLIKKLGNKLVNYLNSNDYIKKQISLEKAFLIEYIKDIKKKISDLEILKKSILKSIQENKIKTIGFNPAELDLNIFNLKTKLIKAQNKLKSLEGYKLATPPVIPKEPYKPKKGLILAVATISGLFIGIFIAFFIAWVENIKKQHEKKEIN